MAIKGKNKSHRGSRPKPRPAASGRGSAAAGSRPAWGPLVVVGVAALLLGGFIGWELGSVTNPGHFSSEGKNQLRSYQGRVDQALGSILKSLDQGGNFIAFADLMTDADAFAAGDLGAGAFRGTASNASAAAEEALATLDTIPIGAVVDAVPEQMGERVGFSLVQFKQALSLYKQAADLFVLAAGTTSSLSEQLMTQAKAVRLAGDDALRAAFAEYNGALREAGLSPRYKGEPAAPVGAS
jgi:hypothetical protein